MPILHAERFVSYPIVSAKSVNYDQFEQLRMSNFSISYFEWKSIGKCISEKHIGIEQLNEMNIFISMRE